VNDHPEGSSEWSFLPAHSTTLAACKWGKLLLDTLSKAVQDFLSWGEDTADAIRIAFGGIRERLVRAVLVTWREGFPFPTALIVDAENFYVLEDWTVDKARRKGITGWVSGCYGYQQGLIQGLE